jgi:hypothetical protein
MRAPSPSLLLLLGACAAEAPPPSPGSPLGGLLAAPPALVFTCVLPGCDTTLEVRLVSTVTRRVAVKRVALSTDDPDFEVTLPRPAPLVLGAAAELAVQVRYRPAGPPRSEDVRLVVAYADASSEPAADRVDPAELLVPLALRLVGEARLAAGPATLTFGVVPAASRKELLLHVANAGEGNLALRVDGWDAGGAPVEVALPPGLTLAPDAGVDVTVTFAPRGEQVLEGTLELRSSTPGVAPARVALVGTSHAAAQLVVRPAEGPLDLGEVPRGTASVTTLRLFNLGGRPLALKRVTVADALHVLSARLRGAPVPRQLQPLERAELELVLAAATPGVLDAAVEIDSDDPARPRLQLRVTGVVTQPLLLATPAALAFGEVPVGWVVSRPLQLVNAGYGALAVKGVSLVGGSATLFSLQGVPALPRTLERGQRLGLEVQFVSRNQAPFTGSVAVETDLAAAPVLEVPLRATGATCAAGCPLANATPSCAGGACAVAACDPGWYDTDRAAANGCECREPAGDPPGFCGSGLDQGSLPDTGASAAYTGVLPAPGDVDWLRFFAEDQSQLFSEGWHVQVRLASSDPAIRMCVYRFDTAAATSACFETNEVCTRAFSRTGTWGSDDGAEFYVKVFRAPGAAPTCVPYTVTSSNGL